ncbi:hypothetical protein YC2023_115079 [Brassica napus]
MAILSGGSEHCPHRSFAQPSPEVRSESEICQRQLSQDSPSMTLRLWQPNHDSPFMAIVYDMEINLVSLYELGGGLLLGVDLNPLAMPTR